LEAVDSLHKQGDPIDDELFERVGKITGLGAKTTIKRLYSEAKRALRRVKLD
jgi:hypothetical protein